MSEKIQVTRRAGVVGLFTLFSRLTGLLRDAIIAFFFGTSISADAFYMAFTLPNLFRRLFAEGSLTIAFIPIFTDFLNRSREEARKVASVVFTYLSLSLLVLSLVGIWQAPLLVKMIAWGFQADPEKFALTAELTRICFPYIFFVSLAAFFMGICNSLKHFASPAAAPIFLNFSIIAGAALFAKVMSPPIFGVAVGVLVGGLLQIFIQLPFVLKARFFPKLDFSHHPALDHLRRLMLPSFFGAAVYQFNVLIVRLFASFLPGGSVSYLWYADRIFEFPVGVFAIAIATAMQPTFSHDASEENWPRFKDHLNFGIRLSLFIAIPSMLGLATLVKPITELIYERGAFGPEATVATAQTLLAFCLGLPFLSLARLCVPAFYALKDAKTPAVIACAVVAINLLFAFVFTKLLMYVGLALALSLSAGVNALGLLVFLRRRLGPLGLLRVVRLTFKSLLAATGMVLILVAMKFLWPLGALPFGLKAIGLVSFILVGAASYGLLARLIGCEEVVQGWRLLRTGNGR